MTDETEKNEMSQGAETGKNRTPLVAVIAVVALVAIGGVVMVSGKSVVNVDQSGQVANAIAPAASGEQASADETAKLDEIAPASANASESESEPVIKLGDPVVAKINGEEIKRSEVFTFIASLPEQVRQMPVQTLFPLALEQVINNKVVNAKADSAKLTGDPEVEKLMTEAKGQIIRNVYVDRQIDSMVDQKKLLKAYEDLLNEIGDVQEIHARHILVDSEEKANEIVKKLDGGADFAALAKENATGPAAENGGDLGWFAKTEMVPEFADAAFKIEPGKYGHDPVKTQFGWHVIKVEESRKRAQPEFEAVKPQLEAKLRQDALTALIEGWQKEAKIQKFDINGDPVKEQKAQ